MDELKKKTDELDKQADELKKKKDVLILADKQEEACLAKYEKCENLTKACVEEHMPSNYKKLKSSKDLEEYNSIYKEQEEMCQYDIDIEECEAEGMKCAEELDKLRYKIFLDFSTNLTKKK
ncbi:MAG: hypothetical protein LE168_05315 [Endomicrobium sp.]|nr:hypothetical protein [Endomicrobium sp.]